MISCCYGTEVPMRSGDLIQPVGTAPVQVIPNISAVRAPHLLLPQAVLYSDPFLHKSYRGARVPLCLGLEMVALCPECSPSFPAWASC